MKEVTYCADTMNMRGPVMDVSTHEVWCDVICASDDDAVEDSLWEVDPEPGTCCAFCGKVLAPVQASIVKEGEGKL